MYQTRKMLLSCGLPVVPFVRCGFPKSTGSDETELQVPLVVGVSL